MLFRRTPLIVFFTLLSLIGMTIAQAQVDCPAPIVAPPENICADLGADQACYISGDVSVFAREAEAELTFSTPGDILDIAVLEALELEGGASVLVNLSANLSDGQFLSGIAYGDLRLEFPSTPVTTLNLTANTNANLRGGAGTNYNTVGSLSANSPVTAVGRNEAGDWYFVQVDDDTSGWVFADLVSIDGDPSTLATLLPDTTTAPDNSGLSTINLIPLAPAEGCMTNAVVLGSPEDAGTARLIVNNVQLEVGSILSILLDVPRNFFEQQILPEAEALLTELQNGLPPSAELVMRVQTLQGLIRATAFVGMMGGNAVDNALSQALAEAYDRVNVPGGVESIIVLDEDLVPVAQPITLPYDDEAVQNLVDSLEPVFDLVDWGSGGITPTPAPTFEEFTALKNSPPEAQPVVGNWQLIDVDPNSMSTSGTAAGGASGGCTSYAPLPSLLADFNIYFTDAGIHIPSLKEPLAYDAENDAFVHVTPQDNGDYSAVAVKGDGTTLNVITAKYEVDSSCPYDEGDLLTTYVYTYERAPEIAAAVPVPVPELKENLGGMWEYVESDQESFTCDTGQVIGLREFAGDELALIFSEKYETVAAVVYSEAVPQRVYVPEDEASGLYMRSNFFYPKTIELRGETIDVASMGYGSQITVEQSIEVPAADSDTLVVREVYNLLMAFDMTVDENLSVEQLPFDCPDVIRNTHTYRRISSDVPAETADYINLLVESSERWVFASAEPREVSCDGATIDPVFDLVELEIVPLVEGAKIWFAVPAFSRNTVGWQGNAFAAAQYSAAANGLVADIADDVTLTITGRDDDGNLQVVKESTVAGCEYSAEIVLRQHSRAIPETDLAPAEVTDSLMGSWQKTSQEPVLSCGGLTNAFQYDFSNLQVQAGQYSEQGLVLTSWIIVYYDPELNIFRGRDDTTGGIVTIPAEVAGDTLEMTLSGPLSKRVGTGNGEQMENCFTPEDTVITVTYKRG